MHTAPTALAFRDAFIDPYYTARSYFADDLKWRNFCAGGNGSANFSSLMLRFKNSLRLPPQIRVSVLADVASRRVFTLQMLAR
jgi:hypothetical protein